MTSELPRPPTTVGAPGRVPGRAGDFRALDGRRSWLLVAFLVAAAVVAPVGVVAVSVLDPSVDVWRSLWSTELPEMLRP